MSKRIPARYIFYFMMIVFPAFTFAGMMLNKVEVFFDLGIVLIGAINIARPSLLMEALKEKSLKKNVDFKQVFSEKSFKLIGIVGGLIMILIGVSDLIFGWLWL